MQNIKEKFSSDPVLEWPKFEASIILDINVSDIDVVYVLSRVIEGVKRVIVYACRSLLTLKSGDENQADKL